LGRIISGKAGGFVTFAPCDSDRSNLHTWERERGREGERERGRGKRERAVCVNVFGLTVMLDVGF
jgi:hypothetical protein